MGTGQDYYSCVFSVLLLALEKMIDKLRRNISGYEKLDDIYNINYKKIQSKVDRLEVIYKGAKP